MFLSRNVCTKLYENYVFTKMVKVCRMCWSVKLVVWASFQMPCRARRCLIKALLDWSVFIVWLSSNCRPRLNMNITDWKRDNVLYLKSSLHTSSTTYDYVIWYPCCHFLLHSINPIFHWICFVHLYFDFIFRDKVHRENTRMTCVALILMHNRPLKTVIAYFAH